MVGGCEGQPHHVEQVRRSDLSLVMLTHSSYTDLSVVMLTSSFKLSVVMLTRSSYTDRLSAGCWSPSRPSVLYLTRESGHLDVWDVLYQQAAPLLSVRVSDTPLTCVRVLSSGALLAVGAEDGNVTMLKVSPSLTKGSR